MKVEDVEIYLKPNCASVLLRPLVANTRPVGRIWPSTLFYLAQHLVSTQQC